VSDHDPATAPAPRPASVLRGIAGGLAGGLVAGAVWFAVVIGTSSMTTYLIPVIGLAAAYGVYAGMHRPGGVAALLAVLCTLASGALSLYYIERYLVGRWFADAGDSAEIPLVPYLDWMGEVIGHAFAKGPGAPAYGVLALVAAAWFGRRGFHDIRRGEHAGRAG